MNEISTRQVFSAILRSLWIAVLVALVLGSSAYMYANTFMDNVYSARSSIFITNGGIINSVEGDTTIKSSDFTASSQLLPSCVGILSTKEAQRALVEYMDSAITYKDINGKISISIRSDDSLFIDIKYSGTDKNDVVNVVNSYAEMAPEYLSSFFGSTINVKHVESASSASKISPRSFVIAVSVAFVGALLVIGISAVLALLDQTIKGENDIVSNYDIPILGVVPDFDILK